MDVHEEGPPGGFADAVAALLPTGLSLRTEGEEDRDFMVALYGVVRAEELAPVPWTAEDKTAFLIWQSELQRDHYRTHYIGAEFLVIEKGGAPIGRLYVHATSREVRVMDIALAPTERGKGAGTALMAAVLAVAGDRGASVTLHVEPGNPAQRLYARLGFRLNEERGVYHFLEWLPGQLKMTS